MSEELTYALLIDAENVSHKYIKIILDELSNSGTVTYRRIYGDWTDSSNNGWKDVLLENSVTPVQQYSYTQGKNASDSAMIIDAMDILYSDNVGGFCLVSSDSDFTRLASRIRESNKNVIGMGESKTPKAFIAACNSFKYLDILYRNHKDEKDNEDSDSEMEETLDQGYNNGKLGSEVHKGILKKRSMAANDKKTRSNPQKSERPRGYFIDADANSKPQPQTSLVTIRKALHNIIGDGSGEDGWLPLSKIGNQLAKRYPDFDVRNYGFSKLSLFIESLGDFEKDQITSASNDKVQHVYFREKNKR